MIWPVIILWVFAVGLIIMGAFHKTPVQLIQNRLDDFEPNGGSRSVPVMSSLFDAPRKAREPVLKAILTMLARLGAPLSQYVPRSPMSRTISREQGTLTGWARWNSWA